MLVEKATSVNYGFDDSEELTDYLSRVALARIDSATNKEHLEFERSRENLIEIKKELTKKKNELTTKMKSLKRFSLIQRILSTIDTLRIEGSIRGRNRKDILNNVKDIKDKSYSDLKDLEGEISIY